MSEAEGVVQEPILVLYVTGYGRSGSTVLDTLLGNHPGFGSYGELINFERVWRDDEFCACGERARACPFWSAVRREWIARIDSTPDDYDRFQGGFRHATDWLRALRHVRFPSQEFDRFGRQTRALLGAIRETSGREWIVDSSKSPARALALSAIPGIDVHLVHLVRDGRGVVWSLKKRFERDDERGIHREIDPRSTMRVAVSWAGANLLAERVASRLPAEKSLRLRYEELVARPDRALSDIGKLTGQDMGLLTERIDADEDLEVGHTLAGNRLRMQGRIRLRPDTEWEMRLGKRDRDKFWLVGGRLMRRYGYARGGPRAERRLVEGGGKV